MQKWSQKGRRLKLYTFIYMGSIFRKTQIFYFCTVPAFKNVQSQEIITIDFLFIHKRFGLNTFKNHWVIVRYCDFFHFPRNSKRYLKIHVSNCLANWIISRLLTLYNSDFWMYSNQSFGAWIKVLQWLFLRMGIFRYKNSIIFFFFWIFLSS